MTSNTAGNGQVTTVGTVPDTVFARTLLEWLVPPGDDPWRSAAAGAVTVTSATTGTGRRLQVVHNWSWEPAPVDVPVSVRDVLDGATTDPGGSLELGPWDVRVLVQD